MNIVEFIKEKEILEKNIFDMINANRDIIEDYYINIINYKRFRPHDLYIKNVDSENIHTLYYIGSGEFESIYISLKWFNEKIENKFK